VSFTLCFENLPFLVPAFLELAAPASLVVEQRKIKSVFVV